MSFLYNKRVFGKTKNISHDNLKVLFSNEKLNYIKLVLLFGSRVSQDYHLQSDYDFAVLVDDGFKNDWGEMSSVWNDICDVLNLADCDIDIVDLKNCNSGIINSIKENYIILKGDDSELQRLFK
jgi:predicted nucleotidyltransferase